MQTSTFYKLSVRKGERKVMPLEPWREDALGPGAVALFIFNLRTNSGAWWTGFRTSRFTPGHKSP
jgi:hypothetical protein